jgi:hypothetical protein
MNEVRSSHYSDFAQLGLEKGKNSKTDAYKQMNEKVKEIKERLKAAGVNKTVAGVNAEEEYEYYDEEDDEEQADKKLDSPDKGESRNSDITAVLDSSHMPRIGGTTMKEMPKIDRGGIPKPIQNNLIKSGI